MLFKNHLEKLTIFNEIRSFQIWKFKVGVNDVYDIPYGVKVCQKIGYETL